MWFYEPREESIVMEYWLLNYWQKHAAYACGLPHGILEYARGNVNNAESVQHFFLVPSENNMRTVIIEILSTKETMKHSLCFKQVLTGVVAHALFILNTPGGR